MSKAKTDPKRVLFAEADNYKILKAARIARDEGIAIPIFMGNPEKIRRLILENELDLLDVPVIDPLAPEMESKRERFGELLWKKRQRKGLTLYDAKKLMRARNYFGSMMVEQGEADALISGLTRSYANTIRPALQVFGQEDEVTRVAGMYIMLTKKGTLFFSDTTVTVDPTAEDLVDIAVLTAAQIEKYNIKPRIAMLSYSNFGSVKGETPAKMQKAVRVLKERYPDMVVDGDIQANVALNQRLLEENFPFSALCGAPANTFIFPKLSAGNICYKLLQELGAAEAIGPVLLGPKKSVHVLQLGSSVREIVNMITIAVVDAQSKPGALSQ